MLAVPTTWTGEWASGGGSRSSSSSCKAPVATGKAKTTFYTNLSWIHEHTNAHIYEYWCMCKHVLSYLSVALASVGCCGCFSSFCCCVGVTLFDMHCSCCCFFVSFWYIPLPLAQSSWPELAEMKKLTPKWRYCGWFFVEFVVKFFKVTPLVFRTLVFNRNNIIII